MILMLFLLFIFPPFCYHSTSIIIIFPPSFRLHHHIHAAINPHHFPSIIIIMPPSSPSIPPSFRLHHAIISPPSPSHHYNHFIQKTILHFGLIMVSIP